MSDNKRGMVRYTSRDYESILQDFKDMVPQLTSLWKPESAADPGYVLGTYLASIGDMLSVNQDWAINEMYAPTVTQRKNAEKIFGLIGYELGWYTAARTEVTFTNTTSNTISVDFGFNGANFGTLNAYSDITGTTRTLTYNILPLSNTFGQSKSRNSRTLISDGLDIFASTDKVSIAPGESVTRVAIEGELRSYSISVDRVKENNFIIKLPSQHVDTTAVWLKSSPSSNQTSSVNWVQVTSPSEFTEPEPRYAVTYDTYSNAQIQVSNYLNQMDVFDNSYITVYWIDCSGVIGSVGADVLTNFLPAVRTTSDVSSLTISNLSNTVELPNKYTVTGASPETAKQAYVNSKKYVGTFDSLITLPDFNRFLAREPGVDCGLVIDCQKALEINLSIYNDKALTDKQKSKMYITNYDFPAGPAIYDWKSVLGLGFDPTDPQKYVFAANFQPYTAMCFAIHNNFQNSSYGYNQTAIAQVENTPKFNRYKPPAKFIEGVIADYRPLQAMSVSLEFGYLRVFNFYVTGQIFTKSPVTQSVGNSIIAAVNEALSIYFDPANRQIGQQPTVMEIVDTVTSADDRILYFDAGSLNTPLINWHNCDPEYFNPISFARFEKLDNSANNIRIAPQCLIC